MLDQLAFSSPFGGFVVSQLMKGITAAIAGEALGFDYRLKLDDAVLRITQVAALRKLIGFVCGLVKAGHGESDVYDELSRFLGDAVDLQRYGAYWQKKRRSIAQSVMKKSVTVSKPKQVGDILKTARLNPYEEIARAHLAELDNAIGNEGWFGGLFATKRDLAKLHSMRDRNDWRAIAVMFERARLGDTDARQNIEDNPSRYDPAACIQ